MWLVPSRQMLEPREAMRVASLEHVVMESPAIRSFRVAALMKKGSSMRLSRFGLGRPGIEGTTSSEYATPNPDRWPRPNLRESSGCPCTISVSEPFSADGC